MRARSALLLTLAGAVVLYVLSRTQRGQSQAVDVVDFVVTTARRIVPWSLPAAGEPYRELLAHASAREQLPALLLARVAYQESRFRPDIIDGRTVSSAGAQGIMQLVPRWHPGVNPLNPAEAIPYAASYLRTLFNRFGAWSLALAAYNAGPSNVDKYNGVPPFPETQAYVREITRDVGLA